MAKREKKSHIWNYFVKSENNRAVCSICKKALSFKTTITNLKYHLERKHIAVYTVFTSRNRLLVEEQKKASPAEDGNNDTNCQKLVDDSSPAGSTNVTSFSPTKRQRLFRSYVTNRTAPQIASNQKHQIDRDLLDLFIQDFQPFSVVEDKGFSKLMKWIPGYKLPGKETISDVMIPALYHKCLASMKDTIFKEAESVSTTMNHLISSNDESYIAITAQYITRQYEFKSVLLECSSLPESHMLSELANGICDVLTKWEIETKINFTVCDNANITTALEEVFKWEHFGCYASTLNLIVQRSLEDIQPTIEKVKKIAGYFKGSSVACEKLLKYQSSIGSSQPKYLIQDIPTRWNSTFYMLQRFIELKEAVITTVALLDKDLPVITNEEWDVCKQLCDILRPFEEVTTSMSGQTYTTGSSVIVTMRCLIGICEKLQQSHKYAEVVKTVITSLKNELVEKLKNVENSSTFALCTFLDPRYKVHIFQDPLAVENIKQIVQNLVVELMEKNINIRESQSVVGEPLETLTAVASISLPPSENISAWNIFNDIIADVRPETSLLGKAVKEINSYINDDILPRLNEIGQNNCPLDWWNKHQHVYPNLAELFRTKCNIMAVSVPYERIFSKMEQLISDGTQSKKVEMLMFLNANADNERL